MTVSELSTLLLNLIDEGHGGVEIRIGDELESGPYLHQEVGGIWQSPDSGDIIFCANDDTRPWREERCGDDLTREGLKSLFDSPPL